jgi:hypothetical protein
MSQPFDSAALCNANGVVSFGATARSIGRHRTGSGRDRNLVAMLAKCCCVAARCKPVVAAGLAGIGGPSGLRHIDWRFPNMLGVDPFNAAASTEIRYLFMARTGGQRSGGTCLLRPGILDVNLFRYCRGVIYFDAQITDQRPLRAVLVVPIAGPPLLVCPDQRTYSDTVQVENEPRAGARICA